MKSVRWYEGINITSNPKTLKNVVMWRARDLTLFSKILIIKALGVSPLVYSATNTDVPREVRNVQGRLFTFFIDQQNRQD